MTVERDAWLSQLSQVLGVPVPSPEEIEAILGMAGVAAHTSERTAAPLSTWMAGRSHMDAESVRALIFELSERLTVEADGDVRGV